jgi:hypothetical protein
MVENNLMKKLCVLCASIINFIVRVFIICLIPRACFIYLCILAP